MDRIEQISATGSITSVANKKRTEPIFQRFLRLLCSVRLGVVLLVLLGLACLTGMLIMQQNVEGFDRYFAELTPAQRLVYGSLGFFNIYHAWYFNALLAGLSLSIILASVDRFPKTWTYVSKPNLTVPVRWLCDQKQTAELEVTGNRDEIGATVAAAMRRAGWKKIAATEKSGRVFIFGQSGVWNRFGAYAVHVGLLTIFTGGFMTAQLGSTGQMPLGLGTSTDLMFETVVDLDKAEQVTMRLPFEITCTDLQQKLIKKEESISAPNTIDWITRFTIRDETGSHDAMVQLNRPLDYRGYRFFQASFVPVGRARSITVNAKPAGGGEVQEVKIPRGGSVDLADGTRIQFKEFRGNFRIGPEDPDENTADYPNPAAILQVTPPGSPSVAAYAFGPQMANIPVAGKPVAGYTYPLADFEKVADQHVLSVQRDPGATVVYVGFVLLFLTLVAVFFFSHQRVWAAVETLENGAVRLVMGGNTNRNANAFDAKFQQFIREVETKIS